MADDPLAIHQARGLSGGHPVCRLVETQLQLGVVARAGLNRARDRPRPVAELHSIHAGPVTSKHRVAHPNGPDGQLVPLADDDPIGRRVGGQHVERLPGGDPEAAALADRELVMAAMAPDGASRAVHDLPGSLTQPGVASEERALALAREEAEVLALALVGHREPGASGDLAGLGLGQLRERKAQSGQRVRRSAESMYVWSLAESTAAANSGPSPSSTTRA